MNYYLNTFLENTRFDQALELVTKALAQEGFGVITTIDVKTTLKQKLDVDFKNYTILGACNPCFAHEALLLEDKIGVLLPCNVLVMEQPDGRIEVAAVEPTASMAVVDNPELVRMSALVKDALSRVLETL